jgi:hypothetical protein
MPDMAKIYNMVEGGRGQPLSPEPTTLFVPLKKDAGGN